MPAPRRRTLVALALAALAAGYALAPAQIPRSDEPDLILTGGKIVTVDDRFTIAQAVAVAAGRILAVGTSSDVARLASPRTRTIELAGRTVVPGLIDNHMHLLRAGATWRREVRLDGVASRREALARLRARALDSGAGDWVFTLGGWTPDQFADDPRPFSREELDAAVPDHPVLLQASYHESYINTRALQALGIGDSRGGPDWVARDEQGRPTGVVEEAGLRAVAARLPAAAAGEIEAGSLAMIADLNRFGVTAVGSAGCDPDLLGRYRQWAEAGRLNARVFCITGLGAASPQQADEAIARVPAMRLFGGDEWIDHVAYGESVYGPLHDPMFVARPAQESDLAQWRRVAAAIAAAGLPLHVHANFEATIDAFLDQIEAIARQTPIRALRWTFAHANQLTSGHLARMRRLGMYAAVHPWAVVNGGVNRRAFGDAAADMAPLRTIQQSGITWGLGSDGSQANQVRPFQTLAWAVTGRMVGGATVMRQPIDREDALIAHTRKNAYLIFQEDRLGSIQPGKSADLVVLDRDYLTVPDDEIEDIEAVMTIVGGRVVFDAR